MCLVSRVSDFEFRRNLRISAFNSGSRVSGLGSRTVRTEKELFTDNLLVLIHFIVEMIRWTGLAPWESEFLFFRQPCIYLPCFRAGTCGPSGQMHSHTTSSPGESKSPLICSPWLRIEGSGLRVDLGSWVSSSRFMVSGFRVRIVHRVQGSGCRAQDLGFRD